jgi:hypothetical protein
MGGVSPGGGTRRERVRGSASGGGAAEGGVHPRAKAHRALSELVTWAGEAQARHKASGRLIRGPSVRTDDL